MKRKADNFLKHWYDKKNRKPLVLRGARQVGKSTYYWLRDGKGNQAKVDFLILKDEMICPVEVKSGKAGSMKSLFQMAKENQTKRAYRFDLLPRIIKEKVSHKIDNETASLELFYAHLSQVDRIGLI